jgi:hypothetical protein
MPDKYDKIGAIVGLGGMTLIVCLAIFAIAFGHGGGC